MSTVSLAPTQSAGFGRIREATQDAFTVVWRNLVGLARTPQLLVFSTIQPVIFVLMFVYVFGGAIGTNVSLPGVGELPYKDFLMPGIFAQTVVFGSVGTAIGLATDMQSGLLERFRSLPMARSAVLVGRTGADLLRNVFVVILMAAVGFAVRAHYHTSLLEYLAGMGLLLLFGYAFSWIFASVGLAVRNPESAQAVAFPVMAPLVFASSAFVPVTSMPGWLQAWAHNQPVSVTISAIRALQVGPESIPGGDSTAVLVLKALAWCVGILVVFAPLAVRRYRKAV
jgi:ABC-2 type transport system permease protein/oleandomycin transport system permease protein